MDAAFDLVQYPGLFNLFLVPPEGRTTGLLAGLHFSQFADLIPVEVESSCAGVAHLAYMPDGYYPVGAALTITGPTFDNVKHKEGALGKLVLSADGSPQELYIVQILTVTVIEDIETIIVIIQQPVNFPICWDRPSIKQSPAGSSKASDEIMSHLPPWAGMTTMIGIEISDDIAIDSNSSLLQLTHADVVEMQEWLQTRFGPRPFHFRISRQVVAVRELNSATESKQKALLTGLQLFGPGQVECGAAFVFTWKGQSDVQERQDGTATTQVKTLLSMSWPETRSYRYDAPKLVIATDNVKYLQDWLKNYVSVAIDTGSVMGRAVNLFRGAFNMDDTTERITDIVIALETLLAPGISTEINYRVAQRASFVVADNPKTRIEIARQIKKAYGVRSNAVHSGGNQSQSSPDFADTCHEFLRQCLKKLLQAESELRDEFCKHRKSHDEKNRFFDALISFGDFDAAYLYWRDSKPRGR